MIPDASLPTTRLLVFDGFDDLDTIGPLEVLANGGFAPRLVRPPGTATAVRSAHGLRLTVADQLSAEDPPRLLLIPGGGWRDRSPVGVRAQTETTLPALLAQLHALGVILASVCTGAMLLAAAGVLDGRPAVTNRIALDDLERAGADVRRGARVVDDGEIVSSGGPSTGIELALHLVGRFRSPEVARAIADGLDYPRTGSQLDAVAGDEPLRARR